MNQGWECPKCGQVYAPWVSQCQVCPGVVATVTQTTPTIYHCSCPTDTAGTKMHHIGCPFAGHTISQPAQT